MKSNHCAAHPSKTLLFPWAGRAYLPSDCTGKRNLLCSMSRFSQYLQKTWGKLLPHLASPKSLLQAVSKVLESAAAPDISQGIPSRSSHTVLKHCTCEPITGAAHGLPSAPLLHLNTGSRDCPTVA